MASKFRTNPLITIIVPAYNVDRYIEATAKSLLNQSYNNIEVVIINDGSTDHTLEKIINISESDSRIKCINQENLGVSAARNRGLEAMTGDYFMFVDSDDLLRRNAVKIMVDAIINTPVDIVCADFESNQYPPSAEYLDVDLQLGTVSIVSSEQAQMKLMYESGIGNGPFSKLFKADRFKSRRFPVNVSIAEDLYYNFIAFGDADKIGIIDTTVYIYLTRIDSAMNSVYTSKKLSGLRALKKLEQAEHQGSVRLSLQTRIFMEAMYNLIQIKNQSKFQAEKIECVAIAKSNRWPVLLDVKSTKKNKVYAILSIVFGCSAAAILIGSRLQNKKEAA